MSPEEERRREEIFNSWSSEERKRRQKKVLAHMAKLYKKAIIASWRRGASRKALHETYCHVSPQSINKWIQDIPQVPIGVTAVGTDNLTDTPQNIAKHEPGQSRF